MMPIVPLYIKREPQTEYQKEQALFAEMKRKNHRSLWILMASLFNTSGIGMRGEPQGHRNMRVRQAEETFQIPCNFADDRRGLISILRSRNETSADRDKNRGRQLCKTQEPVPATREPMLRRAR